MPDIRDGTGGGLLLVDDEPYNLDLLARILRACGYRARTAPDGGAALDAVAAEKPELVLLDIDMPDLDGYEVCSRLKADPASADITAAWAFISAGWRWRRRAGA